MSFIALLFFVAGALLLVFGFKKNNRVLLTFAACFWLASGTCGDFGRGFVEGWRSADQSAPHAAVR